MYTVIYKHKEAELWQNQTTFHTFIKLKANQYKIGRNEYMPRWFDVFCHQFSSLQKAQNFEETYCLLTHCFGEALQDQRLFVEWRNSCPTRHAFFLGYSQKETKLPNIERKKPTNFLVKKTLNSITHRQI